MVTCLLGIRRLRVVVGIRCSTFLQNRNRHENRIGIRIINEVIIIFIITLT